MKNCKSVWLRLLSVAMCALLIMCILPVALAEEASSTTTIRLEGENYVKKLSSNDPNVGTSDALSGGKFLNNTVNGNTVCLGEADTSGLQSIAMYMANPRFAATFDFYLDGVDAPRKIATVNSAVTSSNEDWATYKTFAADVLPSVPAVDLAGVHTLYMTVSVNGGNRNGGNIDYVELTCATPYQRDVWDVTYNFNTDLDLTLSTANRRQTMVTSGKPTLGSTQPGDVFGYANVALENLTSITISHAHDPNAKTVTVKVYRGETFDAATLLGSFVMDKTKINAGNWYDDDNYREEDFVFPDGVDLSGTDNLFFELAEAGNSRGGNYYTFTLHYAQPGLMVDSTTTQSMRYPDATLSSGSYQNSDNNTNGVYSISTGSVLAYTGIGTAGLTGISFNLAPDNGLKIEIYYGDTFDTAQKLAAPMLDTAKTEAATAAGVQWWGEENYRESEFVPLTVPDVGTTNLFIKLTASRANFRSFTLAYSQDISGAWQYEMEDYVWGAYTGAAPNWRRSAAPTMVESPYPDDIFYLGKADLTDLENIVVAAAQGRGSNPPTYVFYADLNVAYPALTETSSGYNVHRYQYDADEITGGVELGRVTVNCTDGWTPTHHYYTAVDHSALAALDAGEHEIYLKVLANGTQYGGNIDYIRFGGLKKGDVDKTLEWSNTALTVTFSGKFNETVSQKTVYSARQLADVLTNTTATPLGGYAFTGWSENPADAEQLFDAGGDITVTAVYEQEPAAKGYHLTVGAGVTAKDGLGSAVDGSTDLSFDQRITVTAEGNVAYWVLDGAKVGFGKNSYTFYVSGNNAIAAILTADAETATPAVVLQQAIGVQGSETFTLTVIAQTSIPAGSTVSEYGVIFTSKVPTTAFLSDPASAVVKVKSSKTGANQQYMAHLLNVKPDKTRYARAYAIVDGVTVYSDTAVQFKTAASGVTTDVRAVA